MYLLIILHQYCSFSVIHIWGFPDEVSRHHKASYELMLAMYSLLSYITNAIVIFRGATSTSPTTVAQSPPYHVQTVITSP